MTLEFYKNPPPPARRADAADRAHPGALDDLALDLISETVKVEARLVSAGFHDPARLLEAGAAVDLRAADFAEPLLGCCYCALWESVNFPGAYIVCGIEAAARAWGVWIPEIGIQHFLEWRVFPLEIDASNIEKYAALVKRAARRRVRYARQWGALIHHIEAERARLAAACAPRFTKETGNSKPKPARLWSARAVAALKGFTRGVTKCFQ